MLEKENAIDQRIFSYLQVQDPDVARLVDMGFASEDSAAALRQCGNNISEAVAYLTGATGHRPARAEQTARGRGGRGTRNYQHSESRIVFILQLTSVMSYLRGAR